MSVLKIKAEEIIRSRRKTISLEIKNDGRLVVRAPLKTPETLIKRAVEQKADWILKKQKEMLKRKRENPPKQWAEGEKFVFLGSEYTLTFSDSASKITAENGYLTVPAAYKDSAQTAIINWYKKEAKKVFSERVRFYAEKHNIKYTSLKTTSALTRWGSCSSKGGLCFTWRLVMAPIDMIDYVVVHELSHLSHLDHSHAFWNRVSELMPDYDLRRQWFKTHSYLLGKDYFAKERGG